MTEREFRKIRIAVEKRVKSLQEECKNEERMSEKFCIIAKMSGHIEALEIVKEIFEKQK